MNWNISLLVFSMTIMVLFAGVGVSVHLPQAESTAEDLAPQFNVDEDDLRNALSDIFKESRLRQTAVYCTPWALMCVLLAIRLVRERKDCRIGVQPKSEIEKQQSK